ncbi:MAG: hypothetical protein HY506_00570 [Candidatus Yanofskybacteria bacterium]|nr:hypothetical protein [Candidatus Yanofskybacteria bacterium]
MAEIKIHDYKADGDPEGLKFLEYLDLNEWETLRYAVDNKGEANVLDSHGKKHYEVTRSSDGIYMISEVKPEGSGWF